MSAAARPGKALPRGPLAIVLATVFIDLVGFGIVLPILPLWAEDFGASPFQVGALATVYAAAQFAMAPLWGRASDRFGRRPVIMVALAGSVVGATLVGLAWTLWVLFAARILHGAAGASYAVAQAYVADLTAPDQRARAMGLIGAAFGLGFILGPAIGAGAVLIDDRAPFFITAALAAINLAAAARWLPETRSAVARAAGRGMGLIAALRGGRLAPLLWLSFATGIAFVAMESTFALFGSHRLGLGPSGVAIAFVELGLLAALAQVVVVPRAVDRLGERSALVAGLAVTAAGLMLLAGVVNVVLLSVALVPLAIGSAVVFATITSLVSQASQATGAALGTSAAANSAARAVGPVLAGWLFGAFGPGWPLIAGAVIFAAAAILATRLIDPATSVAARPVGAPVARDV